MLPTDHVVGYFNYLLRSGTYSRWQQAVTTNRHADVKAFVPSSQLYEGYTSFCTARNITPMQLKRFLTHAKNNSLLQEQVRVSTAKKTTRGYILVDPDKIASILLRDPNQN